MKIKTILLGDKAVGKSYLISHLRGIVHTKKSFYSPTIAVDFFEYMKSGSNLQIWDTSGCRKYAGVRRTFIRDASLFIIVYNNKKSFKKVEGFIDTIDLLSERDKRIIIVSLTTDIELEADGQSLANGYKMPFLTCNVNNREDVIHMWHDIIDICVREVKYNKWIVDKMKPTTLLPARNCWWWFGT